MGAGLNASMGRLIPPLGYANSHSTFHYTSHELGSNSINYCRETMRNHNTREILEAQMDHEFFKDNNATHLDHISKSVHSKQMKPF